MDKCQKCKNKIALIHCNSCSSYFCLECDRLTHNIPKNKNHKRKNNTSSFLNIDYIKRNLSNKHNINYKTPNNKDKKDKKDKADKNKEFISQNNFYKIKDKEDPNIHLIKRLENILNNNIDINEQNIKNEIYLQYKNDFNKFYKYIKITNLKNNIDINKLLNIIEEQDTIINSLFKKIYFLKQQIKQNIFIDKKMLNERPFDMNKITKDEKYFNKKLDIINKIYEKQKEELIKEQEDKILKIKMEYDIVKDRYLSIIKEKDNNIKTNEEINEIIKKLRLDQNNININSNKLSKINDELNINEFCLSGHIDELINKLGNLNIKVQRKENIRNNKIDKGKRFKSFNGKY